MYIIKVLMPFNVLIDTDMGLWNLIQFDYRNDIFFLKGMLDMSDAHKKYFMITRDNRNPLMTILSEPDETLANDFYSQFIDKEYDQILKLSPNTDVCKILDVMKKSKSSIIRLTNDSRSPADWPAVLRGGTNLSADNVRNYKAVRPVPEKMSFMYTLCTI